jgi:hypothetical protein
MHLRARNGPYEGSEHPCFEHPDRVAWAEEDEGLYAQALLYAGVEPEVEYHEYWHESSEGFQTVEYYITAESLVAHERWQADVAEVLMTKYERYWWYIPESHRTPARERAEAVTTNMRKDELRLFYTWLCKQRGESWAQQIEPKSNTS